MAEMLDSPRAKSSARSWTNSVRTCSL